MKIREVWKPALLFAAVYGLFVLIPKYAILVLVILALVWAAENWRKKRGAP
ncbi:MAG: hypothetical protein PHT40_04690 [Patescibacteria group bacterium]|nr:hypothetical protein [Patescibacteria group bacterium]